MHRFEEVSFRDVQLGRDEQAAFKNLRCIYEPRHRQRSIGELGRVVTNSSAAPCPTFTPQSILGTCADMEFMKHCQATNLRLDGPSCWQSALLPRGQLVRQIKGGSPGDWVWSLGDVCEKVVMTWPAAEHNLKGLSQTFSLRPDCQFSDIELRACVNISEWQVIAIRICLRQRQVLEATPSDNLQTAPDRGATTTLAISICCGCLFVELALL